jgi:hypothetical protein
LASKTFVSETPKVREKEIRMNFHSPDARKHDTGSSANSCAASPAATPIVSAATPLGPSDGFSLYHAVALGHLPLYLLERRRYDQAIEAAQKSTNLSTVCFL